MVQSLSLTSCNQFHADFPGETKIPQAEGFNPIVERIYRGDRTNREEAIALPPIKAQEQNLQVGEVGGARGRGETWEDQLERVPRRRELEVASVPLTGAKLSTRNPYRGAY